MINSAVILVIAVSSVAQATYYPRRPYYGYGYGYGYHYCKHPNQEGVILTPYKPYYNEHETVELSCREGYKRQEGYKQTNSTCRYFPGFFGDKGIFMPGIFPDTCVELPMCRLPKADGLIVNETKTLFDEGETIQISCEDGFELAGPDIHTCTAYYYRRRKRVSFGFAAQKVCKEIRDCVAPKQPGLIVEPQKSIYKPGDEINLACVEGYELIVNEISTCQNSGYFSAKKREGEGYRGSENIFIYSNLICRKKARCSRPNFPGLVLSPLKDSYESGEEINITCSDGYHLSIPATSKCGYRDEVHDDIFQYLSKLRGHGAFKPKIGPWTCSVEPRCLPGKKNGVILNPAKSSYALKETVDVTCAEGYELIDKNAKATCERNDVARKFGYSAGQFQPAFHKICKKPPTCRLPRDDGIVVTPEKEVYKLGETASFSCSEDYEKTVDFDSEITCEKSWDSEYPRFRIPKYPCTITSKCVAPKAQPGLIINPGKSKYPVGTSIELSCEEGYRLTGPDSTTCKMDTEKVWRFLHMVSKKIAKFHPYVAGGICEKIEEGEEESSVPVEGEEADESSGTEDLAI